MSFDVEDGEGLNNPLGLSDFESYKINLTETFHQVFSDPSKKNFLNWLMRNRYTNLVEYQDLKILQVALNFAMKHHYIDKEGYILEQILRTKKHLEDESA